MKKTIFFVFLICALFFSCKKEDISKCNNSLDQGKSYDYVEKDTTSRFLNQKIFQIIEVSNCTCKGCIQELRMRNYIDKEVEIKVFQDSTYGTIFTSQTLSVTNWSFQKSFGTKSSIEEFTKFMKISYK